MLMCLPASMCVSLPVPTATPANGRNTGRVQITRADFQDPRLTAFLQAHLDDIEPTAPAESRHALDLTALQEPHVRLWVATDPDGIVGTAALAAVEDRHEELKSMRTEPRVRGRGVASALLDHALDDARSRGVERVSLETGSMAFFEPARALYAKAGFVPCAPFGSYLDDPLSTFMTREIAPR
jgi:putative acetyltransferase